MKIAIIGGGAIGLLLSSYFANRHSVTIYVRRQEQADLINNYKIKRYSNEETTYATVTALLSHNMSLYHYDLIIVAVKQTQLINVLNEIRNDDATNLPLLFIQNGMSHIDQLLTLSSHLIYLGIVEHGTMKMSDNHVNHTGKGLMKISALNGEKQQLEKIVETLHVGDFPVVLEKDWWEMTSEKLVMNAVINPLTAIFRVKNGELIENQFFLQVMKKIFDETILVLKIQQGEELWNKVIAICMKTSENKSSMLVDIEAGRETEVNAISGYILNEAKKQRLSVPSTQFVYESIKGLEISKGRNQDA